MASMQQVNDFAHKWLTLYRADSTTEGMVTEGFADDCFALGFEMDTGKGFIAAFSEDAFTHAAALQTIIDDVMNGFLVTHTRPSFSRSSLSATSSARSCLFSTQRRL